MLVSLTSTTSGVQNIAELIRRLVVEQDDGCIPWAHNVPRLLARKLPALTQFSYANAPFADARAIILHPHMTRIFPAYVASSGWDIKVLELRNQRYTSFADMARIIGSLPRLTTLRCNSVTWRTAPEFPGRAPLRAGPHLLSIEVRECDVHWPFIWLMTSAHRISDRRLGTSSSALDVVPVFSRVESWLINGVVRAWLSKMSVRISETAFSCRHSRVSDVSEGLSWKMCCSCQADADFKLSTGFLMVEAQHATDAGPYLSFDFKNTKRKTSRRASMVSSMASHSDTVNDISFYDLDKGLSSKAVLSMPWEEIDTLLAFFPHLQSVTLAFDKPSSWSSRRLYRTCFAISEAMWEFRASYRLVFKYGTKILHHDDPFAAWVDGTTRHDPHFECIVVDLVNYLGDEDGESSEDSDKDTESESGSNATDTEDEEVVEMPLKGTKRVSRPQSVLFKAIPSSDWLPLPRDRGKGRDPGPLEIVIPR